MRERLFLDGDGEIIPAGGAGIGPVIETGGAGGASVHSARARPATWVGVPI